MSAATTTALNPAQLDQLSVNTVRFLSVDAVQQAMAMAYVLWTRFLRHNPLSPQTAAFDKRGMNSKVLC